MERQEAGIGLEIIPENYSNKDIGDLLEMPLGASDCPLAYPLYFDCIQSAFISFFKNHDRLAPERERVKSHTSDFKSPDNVNNIIAFLGERGSGKTTAINEFGRILDCFGNRKVHAWWEKHLLESLHELKKDDVQFIVLDSIDASLLTVSEDIVELVLAQMYARIEREIQNSRKDNENYQIADAMDCFRIAYQSYHNLSRNESERELGNNVPSILKNIPSGSNVRRAFTNLLECFFQHTKVKESKNQYLVITIDDLDLNIDYGYQLLEKIRKYLSDPRILVLIAADFKQLLRVCEVYWLNQYGQYGLANAVRVYCDNRQYYNSEHFGSNREKHDYQKEHVNSEYHESAMRLSRDYLLKAIPITHRIYLSGVKDAMQKVYIQEKESIIPMKQYIWTKLVHKLGIYYDLTGTKRHFVMPTTVREFVTYNNFLDSLYPLEWKKNLDSKEELSKYDWNHYRMNRDITTRMAHSLLNVSQKEGFESLVNRNILNRAKYTVDFFKNWMWGEEKDRTDTAVYRYGDLLKGIYKLGRNNLHDKKLVHCIMAYFTSEMTREYYGSLFLREQEKRDREEGKIDEADKCAAERKDAEENLRHFLGTSFGNEWLGEILPAIRAISVKGEMVRWGFVRKAQLSAWSMQDAIIKKEESWNAALVGDGLCESLEKNKFIKMLGLCMMLFSNFKESGVTVVIPRVKLEIENKSKKVDLENGENAESGEKEDGKMEKTANDVVKKDLQTEALVYKLSFAVNVADFDVLGFIGKKWDTEEIEQFSVNIVQGITDAIQRVYEADDNWFQEYKDKMMRIAKAQLEEIMGDNEMIFPFYNLDLAYNVLKHARSVSMEKEGIIEAANIYEAMQRVYGYIAVELYKEDCLYDQYGITRHVMDKALNEEKWSMCFVNSPFIRQFGISYPEGMQEKIERKQKTQAAEKVDRRFADVLTGLVSSIHIPFIEDAPDNGEDEEVW